jgi:hypothetical protein
MFHSLIQEHFRKDWMFRLVGSEHFRIGRFDCKLDVEPDGTFGLIYSLFINGQDVTQFQEISKRKWMTWSVEFSPGNRHTVLFGKNHQIFQHQSHHTLIIVL